MFFRNLSASPTPRKDYTTRIKRVGVICKMTTPDGKPYNVIYWGVSQSRQDKSTGVVGPVKRMSKNAAEMYREVMRKWLPQSDI